MDPVTHGLAGAAATQAVSGPHVRNAWLLGAVGGLLPDLDVLIRSAADPLLAIEVHRQFTHSLVFIPVGGLIASLPWLARKRHRPNWKPILAGTTLGYATHGLLDACTTFGTQLLWPFSTYRSAWNWISIIDPIFTLALVIGVVWTARSRSRWPAAAALGFCVLYLGFGALQRARAENVQEQAAALREHVRDRGEVFPTVGNRLVWRSLYEAGDSLYADRIRVPVTGESKWAEGVAVARTDEADLHPAARADPRIREDFRRFRWFTSDWVARGMIDTTVIGDARYSMRHDAFDPVWGVRFLPAERPPTAWVDRSRDRSLGLGELWLEIRGRHPAYRRLDEPDR